MSTPSRRDLLTAGAAAGALATPGVALGAPFQPDRAPQAIHRLRQRWTQFDTELEEALLPRSEYPEVDRAAARMRRSASAMEVVKDLQDEPLDVQITDEGQTLLHELLTSIGEGILLTRDLLRGWLDGAGRISDPHAAHLYGALRALRTGFGEGRLARGRDKLVLASIESLESEPTPAHLRRRVRRSLRRLDRAVRLAGDVSRSDSGVLHSDDPHLRRRVQAAADDSGARPRPKVDALELTLGVLAVGAFLVLGFLVVLLAVCIIACGQTTLAVVLGVALIALVIFGEVVAIKQLIVDPLREDLPSPTAPQAAAQPPSPPEHTTLLDPKRGWSSTGVNHTGQWHWSLSSSGGIVGSGLIPVDTDGADTAAGPGAPLPGAPHRALIARVGATVLFVGAQADLPPELRGIIELRLNVPDDQLAGLEGIISVQLQAEVPPAP